MPETSYCRRCRTTTAWTRTGGQNGSRPVATFWRCGCGVERVALANVDDVEQLALTVVGERRRGATRDESSAKLDYEDAVGAVTAAVYEAYVEWNPARNPSFLSHATWKARCALSDWFRDEIGRDTPKALAFAHSTDALAEASDLHNGDQGASDGYDRVEILAPAAEAFAQASIPHALTVMEDAETTETLRDVVFPIALGYSNAEVAALHGQSEAWVKNRLRRLRQRGDLRLA